MIKNPIDKNQVYFIYFNIAIPSVNYLYTHIYQYIPFKIRITLRKTNGFHKELKKWMNNRLK